MNQIKVTVLLFGFFLISTAITAVEINECEDEAGNRSFQQNCPPGSVSINKKNYKMPGTGPIPTATQNTPIPIVLYLKPDCSICDRVKDFLVVNNVPMTEKNVADSDELREELIAKTGINAGVPVLVIGDQLIRGFDNIKMTSLLRNAGYPVTKVQAP